MIVIKLELHSALDGSVEEIGRAIIHNVGGTKERGDYEVAVGRRNADGNYDNRLVLKSPARSGAVFDYPRLSYNVWRLVIRGLRSAFPEER